MADCSPCQFDPVGSRRPPVPLPSSDQYCVRVIYVGPGPAYGNSGVAWHVRVLRNTTGDKGELTSSASLIYSDKCKADAELLRSIERRLCARLGFCG
ncbi:hypothetical protein NDU88_009425 [Pleurodeles waltl]|uniref:Uncharacterized protein n=1 Tax=Pleurodeles waltl TaxID=8319 RepID=A0AAV7RYD7_PLEWA|nr:hypothetical protein NDU88_009425 [Pleurodeles waltl]